METIEYIEIVVEYSYGCSCGWEGVAHLFFPLEG